MNRPIHFEILSEDPARLAEFYQAVFGWTAATWDAPQQYWLLTTGSPATPGIDGGLMHRHFDQAVINTVSVDDLEDALRRIEGSGGRKVHGPEPVPGVGLHAYCADPEGILFGVLQPEAADGMEATADEEAA